MCLRVFLWRSIADKDPVSGTHDEVGGDVVESGCFHASFWLLWNWVCDLKSCGLTVFLDTYNMLYWLPSPKSVFRFNINPYKNTFELHELMKHEMKLRQAIQSGSATMFCWTSIQSLRLCDEKENLTILFFSSWFQGKLQHCTSSAWEGVRSNY